MPNLTSVLNDYIRRLARREITANTKTVKKATAHYRRDIAALKRQVVQLVKEVAVLKKAAPKEEMPTAAPEALQGARLRVDGLKAHRARLGLSAKEYGKLMGVSGLTIYHWESGKSKPRRSLLPRIVAVRGIGKREAMARLGMTKEGPKAVTATAATPETSKAKSQKRGVFKQTGKEMILGLLKGRKALTATAINVAWTREGRKGTAAVLLSRMTKGKKLKRVVVKGIKGGEYREG